MSVTVREKRGKLYLDIYQNGKRTWESLHLTITKNREQNKEVLRLAEICRSQRETQLLAGAWDIQDPVASKKKLITFIQECAKDYSNPCVIKGMVHHLKKFSTGDTILLSQITPKWVADFYRYLEHDAGLSQSSVANYSNMFYTTIRKAITAKMIIRNPCEGVKKVRMPEVELEFLSIEEIQRPTDTKLDDGDYEIRRAFLFACHTGLRVCDLETMTWREIEKNPMQIIKQQKKTKVQVYIPLSNTAIKIITDGQEHKVTDKVFDLAYDDRRRSYDVLKRWADAAGITKNVSWHTARRTFATLALSNRVDIYTVAKLLGHTSIKQVAKYAKVTDALRREAIAALPDIRL